MPRHFFNFQLSLFAGYDDIKVKKIRPNPLMTSDGNYLNYFIKAENPL